MTGPAAELEVTGEESIALFGSFVFVMGQSPAAARSLLSPTDPQRAGGDPHRAPVPLPEPKGCSFLAFQGRVTACVLSGGYHQYSPPVLALPLPGVLWFVLGRSGGLRRKLALGSEA